MRKQLSYLGGVAAVALIFTIGTKMSPTADLGANTAAAPPVKTVSPGTLQLMEAVSRLEEHARDARAATAGADAPDDAETLALKAEVARLQAAQSERQQKATAVAQQSCLRNGMKYMPMDNVPNGYRTIETSVEACQQRCAALPGCAFFTRYALTRHPQIPPATIVHNITGCISGSTRLCSCCC
jgi:hypothetical protein